MIQNDKLTLVGEKRLKELLAVNHFLATENKKLLADKAGYELEMKKYAALREAAEAIVDWLDKDSPSPFHNNEFFTDCIRLREVLEDRE